MAMLNNQMVAWMILQYPASPTWIRSKELEEFLNFVKGYEARQDNFYKSPLARQDAENEVLQWPSPEMEKLQQQKIGFWPRKMVKNSGIVRCWYIISYPAQMDHRWQCWHTAIWIHMMDYGGIKQLYTIYILVGGLEHFLFFHILWIIIPIDQYFSDGLKPPTSIYI